MAVKVTYDICLHCGRPLEKGNGFFDMAAGRLLCVQCGRVLSQRGECLDCENLILCKGKCENCKCAFNGQCARSNVDFNFKCNNFKNKNKEEKENALQ